MKYEDIYLKEKIAKCRTMDDVCGKNGLLQRLLGDIVEQMLEKKWKNKTF